MALLSPILRSLAGGQVAFWCPGCDGAHAVKTGPGGWGWNGSAEQPTFTPSLLVRTGHHIPNQPNAACWCTWNAEHPNDPAPFKCGVCHSFITDGQIQFLGDCTHELAGQTVPIPPWPVDREAP